MRHLTMQYIEKLVEKALLIKGDEAKEVQARRPRPMPGKTWPTRVAWYIQVADYSQPPSGGLILRNLRSLSYIGKPSRYRALEAHKFLASASGREGVCLARMWQAEFDKAGLLAWRSSRVGQGLRAGSLQAFFAYHPHSATPEVVEAFIKPLHLKYIGGMRLYSQKKRLATEAVEAYYEWYHKHFRHRLRKPRSVPMVTIAGQAVDPNTLEAAATEPEGPQNGTEAQSG